MSTKCSKYMTGGRERKGSNTFFSLGLGFHWGKAGSSSEVTSMAREGRQLLCTWQLQRDLRNTKRSDQAINNSWAGPEGPQRVVPEASQWVTEAGFITGTVQHGKNTVKFSICYVSYILNNHANLKTQVQKFFFLNGKMQKKQVISSKLPNKSPKNPQSY